MACKKQIPYQQILDFVKSGETISRACKKVGMPDASRFYKYAPDRIKSEILGFKTVNSKTVSSRSREIKGGSILSQVFRPDDDDFEIPGCCL